MATESRKKQGKIAAKLLTQVHDPPQKPTITFPQFSWEMQRLWPKRALRIFKTISILRAISCIISSLKASRRWGRVRASPKEASSKIRRSSKIRGRMRKIRYRISLKMKHQNNKFEHNKAQFLQKKPLIRLITRRLFHCTSKSATILVTGQTQRMNEDVTRAYPSRKYP